MNATKFRESVRSFDRGLGRVKGAEDRLLEAVKRFQGRLQDVANAQSERDMSQQHEWARAADELKSRIRDAIRRWTERLAEEAPVKKLSEKYKDRPILLVFGKVNSGKSTFVNLLVEELERAGAGIKGFAIEDGKQIHVDAGFAVGATETTARIQGIEVDDRLVILDSPGLHSVTVENHERTKLYTDSADAVLWLSPSSSPGQVQELGDLREELEGKKPLLPVITKSDVRVEDWCEATGRITAEIRNKSHAVRKEQEDDVLSRARKMGLELEVRPVISISIRAYDGACRSEDARNEAGLSNLYECLIRLVDDAHGSKIGKATRDAQSYIDKQVIGTIEQIVEPQLNYVVAEVDRNIRELEGARRQLKDDVATDAESKLRRIVDRHKDTKNKKAIAEELATAITAKLAEAFHRELTRYVDEVAQPLVALLALSPDDLDDFEDITIDFEQKKGAVARSLSKSLGGAGGAAGGAVAGAALGTVVPGIGNVVGGVIGGILGGLGGNLAGGGIGSLFEDEQVISVPVGVSAEQVSSSARRVLDSRIAKYVDTGIDAVIDTIRSMTAFAVQVNSEIDRFKKEVGAVARP